MVTVTPFLHFLAYGNSDQASFRDTDVEMAFDIMTVPGTIASYYSEATAAFVLTSQHDYLIDPRTPLFQDEIAAPRASHRTLAEWHGASVSGAVASLGLTSLPASFWTPAVVAEMVDEIISRQLNYVSTAPLVQKKLDRYARLLAEAKAEQGQPPPATETKNPRFALAPYFAVAGLTDPWWDVMKLILADCLTQPQHDSIAPVLCVDGRKSGGALLGELLPLIPAGMSDWRFFWITNFDERSATPAELAAVWSAVADNADEHHLVNLYGGYFSILMRHAGLSGFGNGLTYSESRDWPALASTGAAPPRYYVRQLHAFLPPAQAAALIDLDSWFACPCDACTTWLAEGGGSIASLPYHDLKRHFALARAWELSESESASLSSLASNLSTAQRRIDTVRNSTSLVRVPAMGHLGRWATVLEDNV